jgi:hypothetical protein
MPRCKLTEKSIAKLKAPTPTGKPCIYWCAELRGFGVLCSGVTNTRTYVCQRDLPGGRTRRVTIAACNEMSLAEARNAARGMLVEMRRGIDPKAKTAGTLQQTLDAYLQSNKDIKLHTRAIYLRLVNTHLAPWRDRPLASITPVEVDGLHHAIAAKVARRGQHSGHSVANHAVRLLRLLYNFAASRDDTLPRNPVLARRALGNATFVFPSHSRSGHIEEARAWLDAVSEATGIEFSMHDLRRTFVTVAESCDISMYALKALVNHSLGTGVTESYIKMDAERLREPAEKVCNRLSALCGVKKASAGNLLVFNAS